jgi:hypothetical protein
MQSLRIATFNLENLDDTPTAAGSDREPTLAERIEVLRPQLNRIRADVLCLQEVHAQEPDGPRGRSLRSTRSSRGPGTRTTTSRRPSRATATPREA